MITKDVFVRIPIAPRKTVIASRPDLNESHTSFEQSPRNQTLTAKNGGLFRCIDLFGVLRGFMIQPVHFEDVQRLAGALRESLATIA